MSYPGAAVLIAAIPLTAAAHPHAWIDAQTTLLLSAPSTLSAIREEWRFDRDYTAYLLRDSKGELKPLENFTQSSMRNLAAYHYFIDFYAHGAPVTLGAVKAAESSLVNGSLRMRFTIALATPIDISAEISLSVYDPTYYIDFQHVQDHEVLFEGPRAEACSYRVQRAQPSAQALRQAQAMDRSAPVNPSLGKLFAEVMYVHC